MSVSVKIVLAAAKALRTLDSDEGDQSLGLFEWSAPPDADPGDRSVWPMSNPAEGYTIAEETLAADFATDPTDVFVTEVLCRRVPSLGPRPIDLGLWADLARARRPKLVGGPVFCLDVPPSLEYASVGVAQFTARGVPYLALADHRDGTEWLAPYAVELKAKYPGAKFYALATGAVAAELPALLKAKIEPVMLTATDMGKACVYLQKITGQHGLAHSGDPLFEVALNGAVARPIGEGLWTWGWRKSMVDLSPIAAATGALWGLAGKVESKPMIVVSGGGG